MKNHLIDIHIQQKSFKKGQLSILHNLNLSIEQGEFVAIVGKSGVGKTSLLNILGLLDDQFAGDYTLFDKDTRKLTNIEKAEIRNEQIGFVLQESSLIDSLTLRENITLPYVYSKHKQVDEKRLKEIGEQLEIVDLFDKHPKECSGGQKSRAAFARAIIMDPKLLLADEPTASLDQENKENLFDLMKMMNQYGQTTIVTVTHDRELAEKHDRIITLKQEA